MDKYGERLDYEAVAAAQAGQALGTNGAVGDVIENVIAQVTAALTSQVDLKDGGGAAIPLLPANTPIGVYNLQVMARSKVGGWSVVTAAGVTVLVTGRFKQ